MFLYALNNLDTFSLVVLSVAGLGPQVPDYKHIIAMDPEPGRCRRTDGKKWRCSRKVVPDQKYCERHMHRGRQRSRKPVETSKVTLTSETLLARLPDNNSENSTSLSISSPVSLQLMTTPTDVHDSRNSTNSGDATKNSVDLNKDTATIITTIGATRPTSTPITTAKLIYDAKDDGRFKRKHEYGNNIVERSINVSSNGHYNMKIGSKTSLGFGFSPRSVIQGKESTFF